MDVGLFVLIILKCFFSPALSLFLLTQILLLIFICFILLQVIGFPRVIFGWYFSEAQRTHWNFSGKLRLGASLGIRLMIIEELTYSLESLFEQSL